MGQDKGLRYIISMKRLIQRNTEHIENYHLLLAALKAKDKEGCRHCLAEIMQQNIAILYQQYNR